MLFPPRPFLAFLIRGMIAFSFHFLNALRATMFKMCVVLKGRGRKFLMLMCEADKKQQIGAWYSIIDNLWLNCKGNDCIF